MILTKILFKRIVVEKKEDSYILISYHREKEEKNSKIQPGLIGFLNTGAPACQLNVRSQRSWAELFKGGLR